MTRTRPHHRVRLSAQRALVRSEQLEQFGAVRAVPVVPVAWWSRGSWGGKGGWWCRRRRQYAVQQACNCGDCEVRRLPFRLTMRVLFRPIVTGTVTVSSVDYSDGNRTDESRSELTLGTRPVNRGRRRSMVVRSAYAVTRKEQKVHVTEGVSTMTPTAGANVAVGSEPTSIA
ncbi:MAG: hypothetical protein IPK83_24535 [Planctomycetes bacterium]|nr:hypothetical protein [Planctomycetota bacterium]